MTTPEAPFVAFKDQLSRYISKRLGTTQDVDDVLQEVFVRATRNEQKLGMATKPLAWLFTVTNSVVADHFRKTARRLPQGAAVIQDIPAPPASSEQDFQRCLYPLINTLPEKYREAVQHADIKGGSQTTFAKEQSMAISTAKSRVQRGRKMLKAAILDCCHVELSDGGVNLSPKGDCC